MTLNARDRSLVLRWKIIFIASLFLGSAVLWPSLRRYADGDDASVFYEAGARSWGEVLTLAFVPSGWVDLPIRPEIGASPVPTSPPFIFGRWRPFSQFVYVKALWTLGLSPEDYRMINWGLSWLTALCLAWGFMAALSVSKIAPSAEGGWALATLLFWSAPTLFVTAMSFFTVNLAGLFFGLAAKVIFRGNRTRAPFGWEIGLAGVLSFFACQSHENAWWLLGWLGAYLLILKHFGQSEDNVPRFWWPWALILFHVLLFRSVLPPGGPNWTGGSGSDGFAFELGIVVPRAYSYLLSAFNGLSSPLFFWEDANRLQLGVAPSAFPWEFILTAWSIAWILITYFRIKRKPKDAWLNWTCWVSVGIGVLTFLPYSIVRHLRFIYFAKMFTDLTTFSVFLFWLKIPKPRGLMLMPWLLASALASAHMLRSYSWLDYNANDSRNYVETVVRVHPELAQCQPEHPCCIVAPGRIWGRNEWVLSYNLRNGSQYPAIYPEGWPDARCETHLKF